MNEPERADLKSMDVSEEKRRQLGQLFPEAVTETWTEEGRLIHAVDFEKLKAVLGTFSELLTNQKERYGMNWPGKNECLMIIQQPSIATLKPCHEESVNFEQSENLFIEGDNLEVLKLLQKAYYGKVKMIYMDPPYNTGSDFIYPDDYAESLETYLAFSGQIDSEGRKFSTNTSSEGRFHSKWLRMMYPRLYLARNLMQEEGVIFISIDDNEVAKLRLVCDEIFGEQSFIAQIVVQSNKRGQTYKQISKTHEYLLVYTKTEDTEINELPKEGDKDDLNQEDDIGRFNTRELRNRNPKYGRFNRPNLYYPIFVDIQTSDIDGFCSVSLTKNATYTKEILPLNSKSEESCWRWGKELAAKHINRITRQSDLVARKKADGSYGIYEKYRKTTYKAKSIWDDTGVITEQGTIELGKLGLGGYFDFPKPLLLIKTACLLGAGDEGIVLDLTAGSGTTAQAVMEVNAEYGKALSFLLIQLPEPLPRDSAAFKSGFKTIADIGKERVREAAKSLQVARKNRLLFKEAINLDEGMRVFKLDRSNFKVWDSEKAAKSSDAIAKQLELHEQHINPDSTQEDILYELLLKSGFPLTTKVQKLQMAGKDVFSISEGAFLICLEREITKELIKTMADADPLQVICLDEGFKANDQLKANTVQIFKARSQNTNKEAGILFRTV